MLKLFIAEKSFSNEIDKFMLFTETELPGAVIIDLDLHSDNGFQTLTDDTYLIYQMGDFYSAEYAGGYRYDDPAFSIEWPLPVTEILEKNRAGNLFEQPKIGISAMI
jgi:dTDP-4-dehydrorhamnose 3,5-epimerase-like enzyme